MLGFDALGTSPVGSSESDVFVAGFMPANFGNVLVKQLPVTGFMPVHFGTPAVLQVSGFMPVHFGTPTAMLVTGFMPVHFGTPSAIQVSGFKPVHFGNVVLDKLPATGFMPVHFGAGSAQQVFRVSSWRAAKFGTVTLPTTLAPSVDGFMPVRFGRPTVVRFLGNDPNRHLYEYPGLRPVRFGQAHL